MLVQSENFTDNHGRENSLWHYILQEKSFDLLHLKFKHKTWKKLATWANVDLLWMDVLCQSMRTHWCVRSDTSKYHVTLQLNLQTRIPWRTPGLIWTHPAMENLLNIAPFFPATSLGKPVPLLHQTEWENHQQYIYAYKMRAMYHLPEWWENIWWGTC